MNEKIGDKKLRPRYKWYRKPSNLSRPVKLGIGEIKRIASYLKINVPIEEDAIGFLNRYGQDKELTEDEMVEIAPACVYISCKKHNLHISDGEFENACRLKIDEIKKIAEKIEHNL